MKVRLFFILLSCLIISSQPAYAVVNNEIIFGGEAAYPPFEWQEEGHPEGFNIELEDTVAAIGQYRAEHRLGNWPEMIQALEDGTIDVLPMFVSEGRQEKFIFSSPFYFVSHAIYASPDVDKISSLAALSGQRLVVEALSYAHDRMSIEHPNAVIVLAENTLDALQKIENGQADYAVLAFPIATRLINKNNMDIARTGPPFWPRGYAFAVRKDRPELAKWIEDSLNLAIGTGAYNQVYENWKNELEPHQTSLSDILKNTAIILIPLLVVAVFGYIWSWSLKRQVKMKTQEVLDQLMLTEEAESQVVQKDAIFKALVKSSPNTILITGSDGVINFANEKATNLFGWNRDELIGTKLESLVPYSNCVMSPQASIQPDKSESNDAQNLEKTIKTYTKSGEEVDVEFTLTPISLKNENFNVVLIKDVTEKLKIESHLRQSQKMEAIGQLTGGVAHDFNNLLGVIIGNLDLLSSMYPDDDKAQKRINGALKASLSGAELTKRLLAFARKQTLNPQVIDVGAILEEMVPILERTLKGEVELKIQIPQNLSKTFIDIGEFENVILNMAINARDAMPKGGTFTIEVEDIDIDEDFVRTNDENLSPGQFIHITLSDTGSGMPDEVMKHIFEPFFTTKEKGKGTGLGLAMAHGFVKQSRGLMKVYSEEGVGTTFHLYLPVADEGNEVNANSQTVEPEALQGGDETILIVDDEADLADIASAYLDGLGYKTLVVYSGEAAIDLLAEHSEIRLVLTDIIMPGGMDGIELHQHIHEAYPDVKVVYASGFSADALTNKRGHEMKADLVQKPYRKQNLAFVIRNNLDAKPD